MTPWCTNCMHVHTYVMCLVDKMQNKIHTLVLGMFSSIVAYVVKLTSCHSALGILLEQTSSIPRRNFTEASGENFKILKNSNIRFMFDKIHLSFLISYHFSGISVFFCWKIFENNLDFFKNPFLYGPDFT